MVDGKPVLLSAKTKIIQSILLTESLNEIKYKYQMINKLNEILNETSLG